MELDLKDKHFVKLSMHYIDAGKPFCVKVTGLRFKILKYTIPFYFNNFLPQLNKRNISLIIMALKMIFYGFINPEIWAIIIYGVGSKDINFHYQIKNNELHLYFVGQKSRDNILNSMD
jgi:hypothetical protein